MFAFSAWSILACATEVAEAPSESSIGLDRPALSAVGVCDVPPSFSLGGEVSPGLELDQLAYATDLVRVHDPASSAFAYNLVRQGDALDFDLSDATVLQLQQVGLTQLATLRPHGIPAGQQPAAALPADVEDYAIVIEALVERYDGDGVDDMPGLERPITAWEIDNEPSMALEDPNLYVELVAVTVDAIRSADPEALVLIGGAAPIVGEDEGSKEHIERFWQALFGLGVMDDVDIFSLHAPVGAHSDPAALVRAWAELGAPRELSWWITEAGPSDPVEHGRVHEDPAVQADWLDAWLGNALQEVDRVLVCDAQALAAEPLLLDVIAEHNGR